MSRCAFWCRPTEHNEPGYGHVCESTLFAGNLAIELSWDPGSRPALQVVPVQPTDPCAGHMGILTGLTVAAAIVRQFTRSILGHILRKSASRHEHATPPSHSSDTRLAAR